MVRRPPPVNLAAHLSLLRTEGERLGEVAGNTDFDAPVPGCPAWDAEDLLRHVGDVHRWAATVVRERHAERLRADFPGPQGREELLRWYRDGHAALLDVLAATAPEEQFWMWGPAPSPVAFWARRQAHETAVHRFDLEQAAGLRASFADPVAAADGVDEWLTLASRSYSKPVPEGGGRSLLLKADDVAVSWRVRLSNDGVELSSPQAASDCTVRATAGALFELVMNRRPADGLDVTGDASILGVWRRAVTF